MFFFNDTSLFFVPYEWRQLKKIHYYVSTFFFLRMWFFSTSSWLNVAVAAYWKHFSSSLTGCIVIFCILFNQENLYMIHHDSYFHMTFVIQKLNTVKDKFTLFYWCLQPNLISKFMISKLLLFICITRSLSVSLEEIKLIVIVNWVFHV